MPTTVRTSPRPPRATCPVPLSPAHLALAAIVAAAVRCLAMRPRRHPRAPARLASVGAARERAGLVAFRYSHEGVHARNFVALCDLTVWSRWRRVSRPPAIAEFAYFAGIAGAAWPSHPDSGRLATIRHLLLRATRIVIAVT